MNRWLVTLSAYSLAAVFIYSSLVHLQNPYAFLGSIYSYSLTTRWLGVAAAMLFPSLQLTLGLVLLFRRSDWPSAFFLSGILLLLYTIVQVIALWRGLNISCGCFGRPDGNPINWLTVSRTALLGITACVGFWCCPPRSEVANGENNATQM